MKLQKVIAVLIFFIPLYVNAQLQGCLYNGRLYPTRDGSVIVGWFGSCPGGTFVYTGVTTAAYVSSTALCPMVIFNITMC